MQQQALGMIETRGLIPSIEAADVMLKAADVKLQGVVLVGGALVTVMVRGEVSAVKAATDAGAEAAKRVGKLISVDVIARPDTEVAIVLPAPLGSDMCGLHDRQKKPVSNEASKRVHNKKASSRAGKSINKIQTILKQPLIRTFNEKELGALSVLELRKLAREAEGIKIKGREIARANKQLLIKELVQV